MQVACDTVIKISLINITSYQNLILNFGQISATVHIFAQFETE